MSLRQLDRVRDLPQLLLKISKDPIGAVKNPLRLSWPAAFSLQAGAAIVSGAIAAMIEKNFADFLISIFVFPIIMLMSSALFTLFIYYYFAMFASTLLDIRRLYSLVVISALPYFLIHAASGFLPPLDLVGFAVMAILLVVGLVEQFSLARRVVLSLLGVAFCAFFAVWSIAQMMMLK